MNRAVIDPVANAVLYEGYILYPYRPSVKNQQRWTFGGLYPAAYCRQMGDSETSLNRTECLVRGDAETVIEVVIRFLHLTRRQVGAFDPPMAEWSETANHSWRPVERLRVQNRVYQSWQEAEEREVEIEGLTLGAIRGRGTRRAFSFPARSWQEPLTAADGTVPGVLLREQRAIAGEVQLSAEELAPGLFQLAVAVANIDEGGAFSHRDDALLQSLLSAHTLLGVREGQFLSMIDPPEECREFAAACRNSGVWPVLVGNEGEANAMLAAPIILYDYPRVAPESPGNLFDSTEIDEILSLRILTLTDDERQQAGVDERVGALLARTESLSSGEMLGMHGTLRGFTPATGDATMESWDWESSNRQLESVRVGAVELRKGERVRLRPRGRADIFDIALAGMTATVEAIEQDFEGKVYLAVTLDDDPGKDLGALRQTGHRFFFAPEEVEPLAQADTP